MSQIEFRQVAKRYGDFEAVRGIDCLMDAHAFTVILGPSGCGKSTLLRLLAGLEILDAGTINIGGREVNNLPPKDRGCALVFQTYALYPHMSVRDNIGYALKLAKLPSIEREQRIAQVSDLLGLSGLLSRKPHELSGGQRQRVAIGRAIAREPKVLLFDEPLSNLDAQLRTDMRVELRKLHERIGATTVYVTHDQVEAMTLADRIVIMNAGRIEQVGTPEEIYHHPASTFVAGFIGAPPTNLLKGRIGADGATCQLLSGASLALGLTLPAALVGKEVVVGIRPEDLVLVDDHGGTEVSVELVEDLGSHKLVHCALGDLRLIVWTAASQQVAAGKRIRVNAKPDKLHLFDTGSGQRIALTA